MKTPRFIRTSSFRLTAAYACLFATSTAILFGIVYWTATNTLREQVLLSLQSEMTVLEAKARESPGAVATEIEQRVASGKPQLFYYGLLDPLGHRIAGNVPHLGTFEGWRELADTEEEHEDAPATSEHFNPVLMVLGHRLPSGSYLTVATDSSRISEAQEAITDAFAWAAAATLLFALAGGVVLSRGFLGRIDEINRTMRSIMKGNISHRIRTSGTDDELDHLGQTLNEMLDRLQSVMEGLKQVSSDIAHDLRTPLSRVKQCLETARAEAKSVREYDEAVTQALQDADVALSLFDALLRIAQIESHTRRARFNDVDLSSLMDRLVMTYSPVAEDMGKALVSSIAPDIHVCGDQELLAQLFVNLIENALHHTPNGVKVSLSLRRGEEGAIAEVADNGPGIPESERQSVFKRFYRRETSRSTAGMGLGLALVAAISELHNARIELVDNKPGLRVVLRFENEILSPLRGRGKSHERTYL